MYVHVNTENKKSLIMLIYGRSTQSVNSLNILKQKGSIMKLKIVNCYKYQT